MDFIPAKTRTWIYGIALAVVTLLGAYGVLDDSKTSVWIAIVAAILGTGTASLYRPTGPRGTTATTEDTKDTQ